MYLDNNATTRPSPAVAEAVAAALAQFWANPSSVHRAGQAARQQVELARQAAADLIGARPREITFTSGGTEAIDLALRSALGASGRSALRAGSSSYSDSSPTILITTRVEHAAVRELAEALEKSGAAQVRWAPIDSRGIIVLDQLAPLLAGARIASIQWVNNETGIIQPVEQIAALCRDAGVLFHCDATQWVGKMPTPAPHGDTMTFAPHKFHGPKGVGILWSGRSAPVRPAIHGTQEQGRRGGTENVPGILGAGVACREAMQWLKDPAERERLAQLRDRFEQQVLAACPGAVINGGTALQSSGKTGLATGAPRIWNTTNIGFRRLEAEALLLMLSERGLYASAGAACSSGSLDPSPVLLAMGIPPQIAHGSLRFSLSRETTAHEIEEAASIVAETVAKLRASLPVVS